MKDLEPPSSLEKKYNKYNDDSTSIPPRDSKINNNLEKISCGRVSKSNELAVLNSSTGQGKNEDLWPFVQTTKKTIGNVMEVISDVRLLEIIEQLLRKKIIPSTASKNLFDDLNVYSLDLYTPNPNPSPSNIDFSKLAGGIFSESHLPVSTTNYEFK